MKWYLNILIGFVSYLVPTHLEFSMSGWKYWAISASLAFGLNIIRKYLESKEKRS